MFSRDSISNPVERNISVVIHAGNTIHRLPNILQRVATFSVKFTLYDKYHCTMQKSCLILRAFLLQIGNQV